MYHLAMRGVGLLIGLALLALLLYSVWVWRYITVPAAAVYGTAVLIDRYRQ